MKLVMLAACLLVMQSNSNVYSAELPTQVLERVRQNSVCAPHNSGETATAWIETQIIGENAITVNPLVWQRIVHQDPQGAVKEIMKSWYSLADHAENNKVNILRVQADTRGLTYLTIMPETSAQAMQYMYSTEMRRVKRMPTVNLMDTIPGVALPYYALTLCANLAPGKYALQQQDLLLKGVPKNEFSNLPSFRAEFTEDNLLNSLLIERGSEKWKLQIQYKEFNGALRPRIISSENSFERSVLTISHWKLNETNISFNPSELEQPFGIKLDQPTGELLAAIQ